MALGYGYVRDAKPMQINWQEVGEQMTESIQTEVQDRQKRKDDIDKQLFQYNKDLLEQPQGSNAEVNRFIGDFSADAGEAMRNAERLLKSGELSERDFYKFRANATQGTQLMFTAAKKFNEGFDESMRRYAAGESQAKENFLRQQTEGYLKFADNAAYINPLTGEVNVARRYKDKNGDWQVSTNPGEFANASELVQQATAQYNRYDLTGAINAAVQALGARILQESNGRTTQQFFMAIKDRTLTSREQNLLDEAKRNMVSSFTANLDNVSSILTENIGGYDFTYSETKARNNPNLILLNPDNTNNFTTPNGKKQLEAAQRYAEAQFEAGLSGKVVEPQPLSAKERRQLEIAEERNRIAREKLDLDTRKFEGDGDTTKSSVIPEIRNYFDTKFDEITFANDETKMREALLPIVSGFGIKVNESFGGDDRIALVFFEGTNNESEVEINLSDYIDKGNDFKDVVKGLIYSKLSFPDLVKGYKLSVDKDTLINNTGGNAR